MATRFNGTSDNLLWTGVAAALANATDDAWTIGLLLKRAGGLAAWQSLLNTLSSATTYQIASGLNTVDDIYLDFTGSGLRDFPGSNFNNTTSTRLLLISKAAGAVTARLGMKIGSGGTMTHEASSTAGANTVAATRVEFGVQAGIEFFNGWMGIIAVWDGAMSDANKEACGTNWRTSDLWTSVHGQPVMLVEGNVAGASLVDLAGNASSLTATGTTNDAAETLDSWNFDGTGAAATAKSLTLLGVGA